MSANDEHKSVTPIGFSKGTRMVIAYMFIFLYKQMKFWIQAQLCLAIYDFEAHIMLNFSRYSI